MARRKKKGRGRTPDRAAEKARELGPLEPVQPSRRHPADGAPLLGDGEVYAFASGSVFHPAWCGTVGGTWDQHPRSLLVVRRDGAGGRRECQNCLTAPLTAHR